LLSELVIPNYCAPSGNRSANASRSGEPTTRAASRQLLYHFLRVDFARTISCFRESRRALLRMNPYLSFHGDCQAAFAVYEECLGGKIEMSMTYAGSPMASQVPVEWGEKILHITMSLGDLRLQGADAPPDRYEKPQGFSVALALDDAVQASRIFQELSDGGTVQRPLQETFWAQGFGMLTDRFGTPWIIHCAKPILRS
jgi:PhnB protein